MKHLHLFFLVVFALVDSSTARYGMIISETIDNCAPKDKDAKAFDKTNYELIAVSDTEVYSNGSLKFLRDFSNASFHVYTEKLIRNKWCVEVFDAKRPSFCAALRNPTEVWYRKVQKHKLCPLKAGVSFAHLLQVLVRSLQRKPMN
jgi:hypothetical protein